MTLASMMRGASPTVELGRVLSSPAACPIPGAELAARCVEVEILRSGRILEAAIANVGQGVGRGLFVPPAIGDVVFVFFPGGRAVGAVILGGLGSTAVPNPMANDGGGMLLMHPRGVEVRSVDGIDAHGVVMAPLVDGLAGFTTAVVELVATLGINAALPAGPSAALAAMVTTTADFAVDPRVVTFLAEVNASANADLPYVSPSLKTTA